MEAGRGGGEIRIRRRRMKNAVVTVVESNSLALAPLHSIVIDRNVS